MKEFHRDSCQSFNPEKWNERDHQWNNKLFIKESIPQLFHIPLPGTYRRAVRRLWNIAGKANAVPPPEDYLLLSYNPRSWKSDLYMLVTREVPGANNVRISGSFYSKVFDGSFTEIPKYLREMETLLARQEKPAVRHYIYCATCRVCRKKYRHNYIVVFAEV